MRRPPPPEKMKVFASVILSCVVGMMLFLVPDRAMAQDQVKVDVDDIKIDLVNTPEYNYAGDTKKLPKSKEWVEVEVEFKVEGKTENDVAEALEFTYYVMMGDKETMLTEKITHVNVPLDEDIYSVMYISPTTIQKMFGKEVSVSGAVAGVAIEVRHNGALVGGDATVDPSSRWWQSKTQTPGMLRRKSDTPFAPLWWDRYADVEKSR